MRVAVVVVVVLPALAAALYYQSELRAMVVLRPWAKGQPVAVARQLVAAISAGDTAAAEAACPGLKIVTNEAGEVVAAAPPAKMGGPAPFDLAEITPADPGLQDAKVVYLWSSTSVRVQAASQSGSLVRYELVVSEGAWRVIWFSPTSGNL